METIFLVTFKAILPIHPFLYSLLHFGYMVTIHFALQTILKDNLFL